MRISDWSSDVCSSDLQFARRLVEHRFDKAFSFAQRYGLAVADEGEFADLDLISGFLCLGFRQADAGDLGMALSAARAVVPLHRQRMRARDMFDRNNAFKTGRASCRARVCRDGETSGVAIALKK